MSLDITPAVPEGLQIIETYGAGRFSVAGTVYEGSVLVRPLETVRWNIAPDADVTIDAVAPFLDGLAGIDILVIGCGSAFMPPPVGLGEALKHRGLVLEWMDTGAACRTFNVLLAEGRQIAAALVAVE